MRNIIAVVLIFGIASYLYLRDRRPAEPIAFDLASSQRVKVSIIGDSWASGIRIDGAAVHSLPGAKSREIYLSLGLVANDAPDVCVVIAGINDSASHIGADFYAYHMKLIVDALRRAHIAPVVLEIPDYEITRARPKNPLTYIRRFTVDRKNAIAEYRHAARDAIGDATFVKFDGGRAFYGADGVHLNDRGKARLSALIEDAVHRATTPPLPSGLTHRSLVR